MDLTPIMLGLVLFGLFFIYPLPTYIAWYRGHKNFLAIFLLNIFLGFSLLGWVAALVWSALADQESSRYSRRRSRAESTPFDDPVPSPQPQPSPPTYVYYCPHCRRPVPVPAHHVGFGVTCGTCGRQFTATPMG